MKKEKAKYLIVDAQNAIKTTYNFRSDGDLYKSIYTDGDCRLSEIFDKNHVPADLQKLIIKVNLTLFSLNEEAEEYITGIPFDISGAEFSSDDGKSYINSKCTTDSIRFKDEFNYKTYVDVISFINKLRENGCINEYVKSIVQFFNLPMSNRRSNSRVFRPKNN